MADTPRFTVEAAGLFSRHLQRLVEIADQRGLRPLLLEVLREMRQHLQMQPREWGDPYHNYPSLNAVGYGRTISRAGLRVEYSVHVSESVVWISALRPLSNSPFA